MARRYSRDNRGRFAGGGSSSGGGGKVGATARGGRLRTAAGNKRATQTTKAAAAKPSGTVAGKVKRNPAAAGKIGQGKASVATAAKKRIAVPSLKTNTDLGRLGVVSMSAKSKVIRSQNVKNLATEKGKEVLERIQGAGARRGGRETKYNAPGSAGAKRIAKTAATQSRASAFAQQQVYSKGGGAYRGQRPEFNWKRSRGTAKAAAKPAKPASKVDLSGAAFTARTRRAQSKLNAAQKDFSARGRSGSDTRSRKRVETLQSAVASLRTINSRAKRQGLPSSDIFKARAKRSTNPKLSPAEKAARTRQNKAAAKFQANVAAMERARRNR
jgi:hypothetical protein